jgi:hypothetical protein
VSHVHPVRVLVVGDPHMPAGIFASTLAGLGDTAVVTELPLGSPEAPPPRTDSERALRETLRRGAEMAAGEVARLVAGQFPDHLLNPEIAAHKEAAS